MKDGPRYRVFGAYRCVLALGVVVSHTFALAYEDMSAHLLPKVGLGNVAVMAFFILSGFVIAEALATFYVGRPWAFLANRFARLAPPYWTALIVSLAIHGGLMSAGVLRLFDYPAVPPGLFEAENITANVVAIFPLPHRLSMRVEQFYGFVRYYWAVHIEFLFYLGAFAVALVAARLGRIVVIAGVIAALMLHVVHEYVRPIQWGFSFAPYFVLGVCLHAWTTRRDCLAALGGVSAYGLVSFHFVRYAQGQIPISADWVAGLTAPHVALAVALLLAMPIVILILAQLQLGRAPREWDRRFGDLSYPIYLNHYAVSVAFFSIMPSPSIGWMLIAIGASVLVSWALMAAVEWPMMPLRNWIRGRAIRA